MKTFIRDRSRTPAMSKMKFFVTIVCYFQPLLIVTKSLLLNRIAKFIQRDISLHFPSSIAKLYAVKIINRIVSILSNINIKYYLCLFDISFSGNILPLLLVYFNKQLYEYEIWTLLRRTVTLETENKVDS